MEKGKGNQYTKSASPTRAEKQTTKSAALKEAKITTQQASQYELMAANPELVEQVKAEAKENGDIASRSAVMSWPVVQGVGKSGHPVKCRRNDDS